MTEDKYQFIKNAILTSFKRLIFVAVVYLCISNFSYPVTQVGSLTAATCHGLRQPL